ncbi:MAG: ROK family protein [candidate division WOR-3 bacterium]
MKELALGIDVGSTNIKTGLVLKNKVKEFKTLPSNQEKILEELVDIIKSYNSFHFSVIGVGFPGFIEDGKVYNVTSLSSIYGFELQEYLRKKTKFPVYVFNDANAYIFGEVLAGNGKNAKIVVGLTLGTGVGGAIVIDKKVYKGTQGFASEFGHMIIDLEGPECRCGNKGCLEAFVGGYAISNRYKVLSGKEKSVKEIFDEARKRKTIALKVVNDFGFYLGVGINNIVKALDPDLVIIGGGIAKAGNMILKLIKKNQSLESLSFKKVKIKIAKLQDKAGIIGSANWALLKHKTSE